MPQGLTDTICQLNIEHPVGESPAMATNDTEIGGGVNRDPSTLRGGTEITVNGTASDIWLGQLIIEPCLFAEGTAVDGDKSMPACGSHH